MLSWEQQVFLAPLWYQHILTPVMKLGWDKPILHFGENIFKEICEKSCQNPMNIGFKILIVWKWVKSTELTYTGPYRENLPTELTYTGPYRENLPPSGIISLKEIYP